MGHKLMKKPMQKCARLIIAGSFICTALAISIAGLSGTANAQTEGRQFSAEIGELINIAGEYTDRGQTEEALKRLETAIETPDLSAFERTMIYQLMGQYSYELDRSRDAQHYFEKAIDAGGMLPEEVLNIRVVIAQIMIGNGQYREGALRLEEYLISAGEEKPQYIDLLVNAWVQSEDYIRALPWAEKWFEAAEPKERRHYDLMNFLYNVLGMQGRQADIVKDMINRWPEDISLWEAWIYMLDSGGRTEDAFEVMKMLYLGGGLTDESDFLKLVEYFETYNMPYQAAELLEREMATKRIWKTAETQKYLGALYIRAREYERAVPFLEAAASQTDHRDIFNSRGRINSLLAEASYKAGSCAKSERAFKKAIANGYDAGKAHILIGTCYYNQVQSLEPLSCQLTQAERGKAPISKTRNAALAAFNSVPLDSDWRGDASTWVRLIEDEIAAFDGRCMINHVPEGDLCFQKIKQAYAAVILVGEFKLEDESCRKFKLEYDAKYVVEPTK